MSKIDEIEILNNKAQLLDEEVNRIKVSLTSTKSTVEAMDSKMEDSFKKLQESNRELKNKLEHLERYSRDFNIRLIGIEEEEGEDCMTIVLDHFTLLGFEEAHGELENEKMLIAQEEDRMANPGILLRNCTLDHLRGTYFEPRRTHRIKTCLME